MCQQKVPVALFFLSVFLFQMNHQQTVNNQDEKRRKSLAEGELLLFTRSSSSSVPTTSSPSHWTTFPPKAPPPRPRRPFPSIRIVWSRPHVRLVSRRLSPLFDFQCTAKNDTDEPFCHSKCPDVHQWTAGVKAIPSLSHDCPNSCGLCGNSSVCMDRDPRCRLFWSFCRGPFYSYDWKRIYCGRTCKLC